MKAGYYIKLEAKGLAEAVVVEYMRSLFNSDYFGEFYYEEGRLRTLCSSMGTCDLKNFEYKEFYRFKLRDFRNLVNTFLTQIKDHPKGIFYGGDLNIIVPNEELQANGLEDCVTTYLDEAQSFSLSIRPSEDLQEYTLEFGAFNQYPDKEKLVKLNEKVLAKLMETMPGLPKPEIKIHE
jgi:hypothetical protein